MTVGEKKGIKTFEPQDPAILEKIIDVVSGYFKITKEELLSKTRKEEYVKPRQICQHFAVRFTNMTLADLGARLGGKNHATILHSNRAVQNYLDTNDYKYAFHIRYIEKVLLKYIRQSKESVLIRKSRKQIRDGNNKILDKVIMVLDNDAILQPENRRKLVHLHKKLRENNNLLL
jgi:hypothetical protein